MRRTSLKCNATIDLFVDRYGAVAISDFFKIELSDIKEKSEKDCLTLIEVYNPDVAECLLKSIPIKELTKNLPNKHDFLNMSTLNLKCKKLSKKQSFLQYIFKNLTNDFCRCTMYLKRVI